MATTIMNSVATYLEDAIAAEQTSEDLFSRFTDETERGEGERGEGERGETKDFFRQLAQKSRTQHQRLTTRLKEIGGDPSTLKAVASHLLGFAPVVAQHPQSPQEKTTQYLVTTYASIAAEIALYEGLAVVASAAGDSATADLARQLQQAERQDHQAVWKLLGPSAARSFHSVLPA